MPPRMGPPRVPRGRSPQAGDGVIYFSSSQEIPVGLDAQTGTFYDTFNSYLLGLVAVRATYCCTAVRQPHAT